MKKVLSICVAIAMLASVFAFQALAEDRVYTVDFVTASWTVDGTVVTASVEGRDLLAGPVELQEFDTIRLTGFDGGRMLAQVSASDGFSTALEPNGDNEVSLGRPVDPNVNLPGTLRFEVVKWEGPGGEEPGGHGEEPQDRVYTVDFVTASWTVDGTAVTAAVEGKDLQAGPVELRDTDAIRLNGFDSSKMVARVSASDGFSAVLEPNGDNEVSLGRPADPNVNLPGTLRFEVVKREGAGPGEEPGGPGDVPGGPGEEPGDRKFTVDFGAAEWTVDGVHLWVVMWGRDRMDGVLEIEEHDLIRVDGGLDPATMQVRVYADDGFSAELVPNANNEVSLFDLADPTVHLPDTLRFEVEARPGEEPGEEPGEVQGFTLTLKNEAIRDYHTHVVDFLQMTPEEIGITPEEYEAVKKQLGGELSQYDKWICLYQLRAEKDGQEFDEEPCSVAIDMTDAMLGFEDFKLIGVNDEDMSLLDSFALGQKDGKLVGDLPRLGVYALVGDEVQEDLLLGDVDGDGKISSADARLALRASVKLETLSEEATKAADADRDERITSADARLILRRSVGFNDPEYGV